MAFDAAQASKKPAAAPGWLSRWKLGAGLGVPLGTAVAALVLFPLGTQMMATNHEVDGVLPVGKDDVSINSQNTPVDQPVLHDERTDTDANTTTTLSTVTPKEAAKPATVDAEAKQAGDRSCGRHDDDGSRSGPVRWTCLRLRLPSRQSVA